MFGMVSHILSTIQLDRPIRRFGFILYARTAFNTNSHPSSIFLSTFSTNRNFCQQSALPSEFSFKFNSSLRTDLRTLSAVQDTGSEAEVVIHESASFLSACFLCKYKIHQLNNTQFKAHWLKTNEVQNVGLLRVSVRVLTGTP